MRTRRNSRSLAGRWKFAADPEGKGDFGEPDGSIESWQRQVTFFDTEYRLAVQGPSPSPPGAAGSQAPTHRPVVPTLSGLLLDLLALMR